MRVHSFRPGRVTRSDIDQTVIASFKRHAGDSAILIGREHVVRRLASDWQRAVARHRAYWVDLLLPPDGATVRELRAETGAGKKSIRRRLQRLVDEGRVERRQVNGEIRFFLATADLSEQLEGRERPPQPA